jgi:hypothetical protein
MAAEPDYLAKITRSLFRPVLKSHGFQEYSTKCYFRLCGKIAQFLTLQKNKFGDDTFAINYFIFILVPPRKFIGSILAGRFPKKPSRVDGWWAANTLESAESSIHEVNDLFVTFGLPLFSDTSTLLGYVDCIRKRQIDSANANATIGCALALAGELSDSCRYLDKARSQYAGYAPGRIRPEFRIESIRYMNKLIAAIGTNQHEKLLDDWYAQSVKNLKLDKKWKA